ncbi:MAG TPA: type II secretion system protein [Longimicrobiaceae bacterium]|nr:type II secretion system protein [Longimicrobiaceae bacterium]
MKNASGYSLIEILTVLTLLGILAGIAVPRIDVTYYRMNSAMQTVSSSLLAAQRSAVQEQHNVVVAFEDDGGRFRVHEDANNNLVMDAGEVVRMDSLGTGVRFGLGGAASRFATSEAVSFSYEQAGWPAVVFYRNGSASAEGGFHMTSLRAMTSSEYTRDTRAMVIERSTGRPTWYRYTTSGWEQGT